MATLTVASLGQYSVGIGDIGLTAANAGGDSFANDGASLFTAANGSGGNITVTVTGVAGSASYNYAIPITRSVLAGKTGILGPFPVRIFSGTCAVTYSGVTSLTVAPVSLQTALSTPNG